MDGPLFTRVSLWLLAMRCPCWHESELEVQERFKIVLTFLLAATCGEHLERRGRPCTRMRRHAAAARAKRLLSYTVKRRRRGEEATWHAFAA
eukprot:15482965-Alexandrium_andersonii.AAC.1